MPITCVTFDYGSVLAWPPTSANCERLAAAAGMEPETLLARYYRERSAYDRDSIDSREYWKRVTDGYAAADNPDTLAELARLDVEIWCEPNAATVEWLPILRAAGLATAIISNMPGAFASALEVRDRWLEWFDHRVFSGHVRMNKPEPAIFHHLLSRFEAAGAPRQPDEVLFLDDLEKNVAAAREAGFRAEVYNAFTGGLAEIAERYGLPAPPAENPTPERVADIAWAPHMHA